MLEGELHTSEPRDVLTLPTTIRLHLNWRSRQFYLTFGILFVLLDIIIACTFASVRGTPDFALSYVIFIEGGLLAFLLFILAIRWYAANERIDITDEGLRVRRYGVGMRHQIRWADARLFALVGTQEFEVAGPKNIVRWWYPLDASSAAPSVPFPEYLRQMDALLLLVRERTGRALYHLPDSSSFHRRG